MKKKVADIIKLLQNFEDLDDIISNNYLNGHSSELYLT